MSTKPNHKPGPCRLHSQGQYCRFETRCKFRHDLGPHSDRSPSKQAILPEIANRTDLSNQSSNSVPPSQRSASGTSDDHPRPKREIPCRAWKAGTCTRGSKCWYAHDVKAQKSETESIVMNEREAKSSQADVGLPSGLQTDVPSEQPHAHHDPQSRDRTCRYWKAGSCKRGANCQFVHGHEVESHSHSPRTPAQQVEAIAREAETAFTREDEAAAARETKTVARKAKAIVAREAQATAIREAEADIAREVQAAAALERARLRAKQEAAKTMTQVVLGSIVTYSAGLDIPSLITGFETCTLHVKNLPLNVKEDEVHGLFTQQGMDIQRFHLVGIKKGSREKLEAQIVSDADAGRALAEMLDGLDFRDETLAVEVSANNTLEGMSVATSRDSEVLTISWRAPSVRYVAEFLDMATTNEKVRQLDRHICAGRRVKVEINTLPPGRVIRDFRPNSIKINFLPPSITDEEVIAFTGSSSVKRLTVGGHLSVISVEEAARMLRNDIERAVPNALRQFDPPSGSPSPEGVVSARAHFSSWDEAHAAHTSLSDKRYGNQSTWFKLPDPMHFTITIPSEQYIAQKAQWDGLLSSIKDRKACILNVHNVGNIVHIRLSGSIKEAIGALKVRVENLARGEPVEGWHRCLGFSNNPFPRHVFVETGAYLRADWKRQSLKVYGASRAIDQARDLIKSELERLASMDYTVTLARSSVGFFVREGIPQLKETLGENNIKFAMNTRKITVTGGDDARHALERLVALSLDNNHSLPDASEGGQTCPICYDDVTSPHQLGCGHVYCIACLRHYISSSLESTQLPLTCLGDETRCHVPIPIPTIQHFLPPASFNRLLEAAFDSYVSKHPEELKFCKTPDCGQIYRSVRPGESAKSLRCPSCFAAVCNACDEDAHDGLTCAESKIRKDPAEQDRLNDAWIASQGGRVKKCPRCSVIIEKLEGCNHMSCRCGAHICWRCMGIFTEQTIYHHMHSAHGGIHGDEPVVPNPVPAIQIDPILAGVNVEEQRRLLDEAQRTAQLRRAAEIRDLNANRAAGVGYQLRFDWMNQIREEERRHQQEVRAREERQQRERERRQHEWERQQRERERARQDSGWGCTIM